MTAEVERNLNYTKDSSTNVGFGDTYHRAIEEGFKSGKKEILLPETFKAYGEAELMVWRPKVTEMETRPGFYNFNGFQATLMREGMDPVTQSIANFKMCGMTVEQSHFALQGGTVLHSEWDRKNEQKKFVYSRLDLSSPRPEGENYPIIRINAKDLDMSRLLSKEDLVANQKDKEELIANLQTGARIQVSVREKVNGALQFPKVYLQLNLLDDKTMGLSVTDAKGEELRVQRQEVRSKMSPTLGRRPDSVHDDSWS